MKQYQIGELADILGLTKEGIRYLERNGLLPEKRNEKNNYRYYTRKDITTIQYIYFYNSIGFTLKQAQSIHLHSTADELDKALEEKSEDLDRQIQELQKKKNLIQLQKSRIQWAYHAREEINFERVPAMLYLPVETGNSDKRHQLMENRWIQAMPQTMLAKQLFYENGRLQDLKGISVEKELAEKLQLPVDESVIEYPEEECVVVYMKRPDGRHEKLIPIFEWIKNHDYRITQKMLVSTLLAINEENQKLLISQIRVPVKRKKGA
ncbi:MerR family transcriptional regulator [Holdemania filiformis]|uniref:MerR family transcriptional regulator n=1 Tax=Holdemania filiformis TaxID=61171 RepID=UPI0024305F46|nr:MerR family transcriptional regulator [Holdemania filiformis]